MTNMVYGIASGSFSGSVGTITSLWNAGYADFVYIQNSLFSGYNDMSPCPSDFIAACNAVGASPIYQTSGSGTGGCSTDCNGYYASLAASGVQAAGGESENASEDAAIMANLIFYNMGGEKTGGATGNNDIFGGLAKAAVTGYGCASYLESYTESGVISASDMGTVAGVNKDAGCLEVGIVIGDWVSHEYSTYSDKYMAMVDEYASNGVMCAGFLYWNIGIGGTNYPNKIMMSQLMDTYPPIKSNIKSRFVGKAGVA